MAHVLNAVVIVVVYYMVGVAVPMASVVIILSMANMVAIHRNMRRD